MQLYASIISNKSPPNGWPMHISPIYPSGDLFYKYGLISNARFETLTIIEMKLAVV